MPDKIHDFEHSVPVTMRPTCSKTDLKHGDAESLIAPFEPMA